MDLVLTPQYGWLVGWSVSCLLFLLCSCCFLFLFCCSVCMYICAFELFLLFSHSGRDFCLLVLLLFLFLLDFVWFGFAPRFFCLCFFWFLFCHLLFTCTNSAIHKPVLQPKVERQ